MYTLLLRLGGPLQSWGSSSLYDTRETDAMPTKSGGVGMLASALGRKRDESLEDLDALQFGVRIDAEGQRLKDYQITHMGDKLNANISNRYYLSDALFLVGFSSEDEALIKSLDDAVNHPRFPLFLGRRSCPPSMPLNLGIRQKDLYHALYDEPWLVPAWRQKERFRFYHEVRLRIVVDAEEGAVKKDVPISFSPYRRQYRYRYIREMPAKILQNPEDEHDPFRELG